MRKITRYIWYTGKLTRPMRLLVVSDLHNGRYGDILPLLSEVDVLLMPGDLAERHGQFFKRGIAFLREATQIVPVYLGIGNHEMRLKTYADFARQVEETGTKLLFNSYERFGELVIGCWYRPKHFGHEDMLAAFQAEDGCRILMSHRPEDYAVLSGGQGCGFGALRACARRAVAVFRPHGVFAPGQGLFPKYTKGIVDKMIISAGAGGNAPAPRIFNPKEILLIELD